MNECKPLVPDLTEGASDDTATTPARRLLQFGRQGLATRFQPGLFAQRTPVALHQPPPPYCEGEPERLT